MEKRENVGNFILLHTSPNLLCFFFFHCAHHVFYFVRRTQVGAEGG